MCDRCLMPKQAKKIFPSKANYEAEKVLDLIHRDPCGTISPDTTSGNMYFFLLVDDYSHFMWVFFHKTKDEAFKVFKLFYAQVEKKTDQKIKTFRTDRGN